jgi:hypothetical protein
MKPLAADIEPADGQLVGKTITTPPLDKRYRERVEDNQDLVTIVSDFHNRRGTGKTVFSLLLADHFDCTEQGVTKSKCSLDASELIDSYTREPKGSALVLDEAEAQASKYRASSSVNKALRELVSMGRVEEKYLIMNLPASSELDQDLLGLADVWVLITRKGEAIVHLLRNEPYNSKLLTPKSEVVEWSELPKGTDLRSVYNELDRQKKARLRGEEGDPMIKESEARERAERAAKDARQETRDEIITNLIDDELGPSDVVHAFDITQQRIGQIARED